MGIVQTACCGGFRNYIQKNVDGILVIDAHKLHSKDSLQSIKDEKHIKNIIKNSLISLQQKSNIFIPHHQRGQGEKQMQNQEIQKSEGVCGMKYKISSKNNTVHAQNIEFASYKLNTMSWPYVVSFSLNIDMIEGDHIFCENLDKQCYEIFDGFQDFGEINFISCYWFMGEKDLSNTNQPNLLNMNKEKQQQEERFITDNDEQQKLYFHQQTPKGKEELKNQLSVGDKNYNNFKQIMEEDDEATEDRPPKLEISQEYFNRNYKKILLIYESESQSIYLYYDSLKDKLLTVKEIKNQYDHIDSTHQLIQNERQRILRAIRDNHLPIAERFIEKYDDDIKALKRNLVREIMICYFCSQTNLKTGVIKMEGVIVGEKEYKLVYEYFGGTEINSPIITCDLESYITKNIKNYFQHKNLQQSQELIQEIMFNIIDTVDQLHKQGIFMREILLKNILIRRRFNPIQPLQSIYEIQIINFEKSKKIQQEQNDQSQVLYQKKHLSNQPSQKILTKPQQLFGKENNDNKDSKDFERDDTFSLGILLYKLYQSMGLEEHIDKHTQDNLKRMTGLPYEQMKEFYGIMNKVKQLFKGGLEEALKFEEKINTLDSIKKDWNQDILLTDN